MSNIEDENPSSDEKKKIRYAPSNNLNVAYPHFDTAKEMYAHLRSITQPVRLSSLSLYCMALTTNLGVYRSQFNVSFFFSIRVENLWCEILWE
jgi:hypothetical protein